MSKVKDMANKLPAGVRSSLYTVYENISSLGEFTQDYIRFKKYNAASDNAASDSMRGINLEAQLTKDYHRVEKGLALPAPKRPFGKEVSARLQRFVGLLEKSEVNNKAELLHNVHSAQEALSSWNKDGIIDAEIAPLGPDWRGIENPEYFFSTRHSVRNFSPEQPKLSVIEHAVQLAQSTPSVCNRQAGRAHYFSDPETVKKILNLQRGNTGFTDSIPAVFVVSVESQLFAGRGERNQKWIDGGLFAMTLVWSLHSLGIASCMLNWSKTNSLSKKLRDITDIPASEDIIVVIAVGQPAEGYRVARSPKRALADVFKNHSKTDFPLGDGQS